MAYEVYYFDGKTSKAHKTTLELFTDYIYLKEIPKQYSFDDIIVGPKLNKTAQKISFSDGAHCEFCDDVHFTLPGKASGKFVIHLEKKIKYALISFAAIVLFAFLSLTLGSTYIANIVADKAPQEMIDLLSKNVLEALDKAYLKPSQLDQEKRDYLTKEFQKMVKNSNHTYTLYFRTSPVMGANAFALPSGEIVLLDGLVKLDDDPKLRGILGVLAHEAGHVEYRHGMKSIAKASITSAVLGYFIGDFSGFATMLGSFTMNAKYSREFEDEADAYAIELTKENNISTKYIADIFEKLLSTYETFGLFDTHPSMRDRIEIFKQEH